MRNAPGTVACDRRVADAHLAGVAAVDAGGGANELALAFAFDAGEPDDLAGMDREIDLIEAVPAQAWRRQTAAARPTLALAGKIWPSGRPAISATISPA